MTNEDIETVAARVYELATVKNLPPDHAKRHIAEVLRQFAAVPYEEAAGACQQLTDREAERMGLKHYKHLTGYQCVGVVRALKDAIAQDAVSA